MNPPEVIKVACYDIKVIPWTIDQSLSRDAYGEFSQSEEAIKFREHMKGPQLVDTIIHEINHAIYWAYAINDSDEEERICTAFATAWTQVYRDNPALLTFIQKELR